MRHSLIAVAAVAIAAGFALGAGPATAAPLTKIDSVNTQSGTVESVRYWRRWGYAPYRYWAPYRYYVPPRYRYYYGPPYSRYYRPYRYYYDGPYYGRRYWW